MNHWMRMSSSALASIPREKTRTLGQLGVPRMDCEHAVLADLIEHLGGVCAIENAKDCHGCILSVRDLCHASLSHFIAAMTGYVRDHFRYEERLMEGIMPQDSVIDHKADHARIETQILALVDNFKHDGNSAAASRLLASELRDWLAHHTETHDALLASYVMTEEHQ